MIRRRRRLLFVVTVGVLPWLATGCKSLQPKSGIDKFLSKNPERQDTSQALTAKSESLVNLADTSKSFREGSADLPMCQKEPVAWVDKLEPVETVGNIDSLEKLLSSWGRIGVSPSRSLPNDGHARSRPTDDEPGEPEASVVLTSFTESRSSKPVNKICCVVNSDISNRSDVNIAESNFNEFDDNTANPFLVIDVQPQSCEVVVDSVSRLRQTLEALNREIANHDPVAMDPKLRGELLEQLIEHLQRLGSVSPTLSPDESQSWREQLAALRQMIRMSRRPNTRGDRRIRDLQRCVVRLRSAVNRLSDQIPLHISNACLCTAIYGFNDMDFATESAISPGERLLVYCEIENLSSIERSETTCGEVDTSDKKTMFRSEVRGKIEFVDQSNHIVSAHEFPLVVDETSQRRRDFFVYFPITVPELPGGKYRVRLILQDALNSRLANDESIELIFP